MGWVKSNPPAKNRHTLRAQKLDAKAEQARRKAVRKRDAAQLVRAEQLQRRADRSAAKGGWL